MAMRTRFSSVRTLFIPHLSLRAQTGFNMDSTRFPRNNLVRLDAFEEKSMLMGTAKLHLSSRAYSLLIPTSGGRRFHEAVLRGDIDEFERLDKLELNKNSLNSAGRLPLHVFCSAPWMHDEFPLDGHVPRPAMEWLLEHTSYIDTPDRDGITALHIASMMSQYLVRKLLTAGADPVQTTCDGMNALHLAARARNSNIVGLLIESLRKGGKKIQHDQINARDQDGRTPLHYACRSGRPETVSYMIAAGADPFLTDFNGLAPLDACLEFNEEQALWEDFLELELEDYYWIGYVHLPYDWAAQAFGGVRKQDDSRPWIRPSRELQRALDLISRGPQTKESFRIASVQHTARLEEILDTVTKALIDRGQRSQSVQNHIAKCQKRCEMKGLEYMRSCLIGLEKDVATINHSVGTCIRSNQSELEQRFGTRADQPGDHVHLALVDMLLRRRQYHVVEDALRDDGSCLPLLESDVYDIAKLLAKNGFVRLLKTMIYHKHGFRIRLGPSLSSDPIDPLLIVAVQRKLPNMDVVRLLVEKGRVDINSRSRTRDEARADLEGPSDYWGDDIHQPGLNTALHECAKGFNWWQVAECLPYLLSRGADVNLENEAGLTPYRVTQADYQETFMDDARKLLESHLARR